MTVTGQLIELLQRERRALKERQWDDMVSIAEAKSKIVDQLPETFDRGEAEQIEALSAENERLLNVMRKAATSVRERLTGYSSRAEAVAYVPDGHRLKVEGNRQPKRV
ncbi:MAG: hypothetical protein ACWA5T_01850 [Parvularcula sp.]